MSGIVIEDYDLFAGLTRRQRRKVERLFTSATFRPGRRLMEEGTHGRECLVIVSGTVVVERHGERIAELGPGDVVGEVALLASGAERIRTATVTAVGAVEALVFTPLNFELLLAQYPHIAARVQRLALHRVADDTVDEYAG